MPQLSSVRQLAVLQIHHTSGVGGPNTFWPELVPDLKLVVVFSDETRCGLHLENPAGDRVMNAMTPSDVCPGAMIYCGTKEGISKACYMASFLANTKRISYAIVGLCPCFKTDPHLGKRKGTLRLRVADTHDYVGLRNDKPMCFHGMTESSPVVILPWRDEIASVGGYKVAKKALVLEEVNGGLLTWGHQLGHINAAQMNGVGQHVFFGPLELA